MDREMVMRHKIFGLMVYPIIGLLCVGISGSAWAASNASSSESQTESSHHSDLKTMLDPVKADPHKAALINIELGLGYLEQGQVSRAKTKFIRALKLAPRVSETHSAMSYFWEMTGEFKDAEKEHKKAISFSTMKGAVYNNYGAFLCRRDRLKEADHAFLQALQDKQYAHTAEIYENAGLCAVKADNLSKAKEYFQTSIVRDPRRSTVLIELADLNLKTGQLQEARGCLERYRAMSEPTARSLWVGIQIARMLKEDNRVAGQALLLKNLFENSPEYAMYLQSEREGR
jgi:type IV pilus assembly protein PilF